MPSNIITPSPAEAQALLASDGVPLLVDFSAAWCGPCQSFAPILERFSTEFAGKVITVNLDVDEHKAIAAQVGIRSVPTLLLVQNGEVLAAKAGALSLPALRAFVAPYLR